MDTQQIKYIQDKIKWVKKTAFDMVINAGKGHMGGSFSIVDVLSSLYYGNILKFDAKNPKMKDRDRLILSKGHANNTLYVILADLGFFPMEELNRYTKNGALLGGHCDPIIPGIEVLTGSLGHGLGLACGIAMAAKLNNEDFHTYCIIGDGESQEGSIWEAIMFAAQHKLNNLTVIVDWNGIQGSGHVLDIIDIDFVKEGSFLNIANHIGWDSAFLPGHDIEVLKEYLSRTSHRNWPVLYLAKTIKGKGVSFMENNPEWHAKWPNPEEEKQMLEELS